MTEVTATELQSKTGAIIDQALLTPVQVTRNKRSVIVLLSTQEYKRLTALEDAYWGEMATIAASTDSVDDKDVKALLARLG